MPLVKVIFALNMLSSKATCYGIHNALELAIPQARCHSFTASIHCMQNTMYVILRLGSPCSVHKHELHMLDSTAT